MRHRLRHIHFSGTVGLKKSVCTIVFGLCMSLIALKAQGTVASEYQVKAVFLYNFTHFIDWPPASFDSPYAPFIIGVAGNDPFGAALEAAVQGERIGSHLIRIEHYKSAGEIGRCHILYVGSQDPDEIKNILSVVNGRNILTVGDTPNFIRWGGMIRFYTEENKIRLQINNTAAKTARLKISSKLLRVSQVS